MKGIKKEGKGEEENRKKSMNETIQTQNKTEKLSP